MLVKGALEGNEFMLKDIVQSQYNKDKFSTIDTQCSPMRTSYGMSVQSGVHAVPLLLLCCMWYNVTIDVWGVVTVEPLYKDNPQGSHGVLISWKSPYIWT